MRAHFSPLCQSGFPKARLPPSGSQVSSAGQHTRPISVCCIAGLRVPRQIGQCVCASDGPIAGQRSTCFAIDQSSPANYFFPHKFAADALERAAELVAVFVAAETEREKIAADEKEAETRSLWQFVERCACAPHTPIAKWLHRARASGCGRVLAQVEWRRRTRSQWAAQLALLQLDRRAAERRGETQEEATQRQIGQSQGAEAKREPVGARTNSETHTHKWLPAHLINQPKTISPYQSISLNYTTTTTATATATTTTSRQLYHKGGQTTTTKQTQPIAPSSLQDHSISHQTAHTRGTSPTHKGQPIRTSGPNFKSNEQLQSATQYSELIH